MCFLIDMDVTRPDTRVSKCYSIMNIWKLCVNTVFKLWYLYSTHYLKTHIL